MSKSKNRKKDMDLLSKPWFWVGIFIVVSAVVVLLFFLLGSIPSSDGDTTQSTEMNIEITETSPIALEYGLVITDMGKYSGSYMEDGSNDQVSDVMMLIVENTAEKDLQLARINIQYADFTASFQITNVPAGESVMVLEQKRHQVVKEEFKRIETKDIAFFQEPMSLHEDKFEYSLGEGYIEIKNKQETPITGDIYVYYKNCSEDMFHGGITYRAKIEGVLAGQQTKRVKTGHFDPATCSLLMISFAG